MGTLPPTSPTFSKRTLFIASGGVIVIALLVFTVLIYSNRGKQTNSNTASLSSSAVSKASLTPNPTPIPTPVLQASHLNGLLVPAGQEDLRPLAVMIENHPQARPQSGLGEADIVYEAIAEGGITRFMAVFGQAANSVKVGPIRSARPYYVDFATELGAMYAHAGGSQDALTQIASTGVKDLNGLTLGSPIFTRDLSRNVDYEHTLYSNTKLLWDYGINTAHWPATGDYQPWLFGPEVPAAQRPTNENISVKVSTSDYDVAWKYDPATNTYLRSQAGVAHIDAVTGKQIAVKDIVIQTVQREDYTETYGSIQKQVGRVTLTGSGPAVIFKNGVAIQATWKKSDTDRTRYYDRTGNEITFVPGPIWVHLVQPDSLVSY